MEFLREIVAKQTFRDSPAAALRELIQNAHDACMIQSAITNKAEYSVYITLDPAEKTITIQDNGIGMTLSDIDEYLTTIGKGKKGSEILEKFSGIPLDKRRLGNVIGEFGFGFVASFIIADKIELWTRAARGTPKGIYCEFSIEDVAYKCEEIDQNVEVGTKLVLHLNRKTYARAFKPTDNPLEGNILSWDTVEAIIKKYCIFLEFPIYVTMKGEPAPTPSNHVELPWESEQKLKERVQRFYDLRTGRGNLGEILHTIRISLSRDRGDAIDLEGVLFIEEAPSTASGTPGNLEIFVKRMWVCEREQSLLPRWASFLRGMIVTADLRPLPGRDALDVQHNSYDHVKNALHEVISDAFLAFAQNNQKAFNTMLERYGATFRWGLVDEHNRAVNERRSFREAQLVRYVRFIRYSKRYMNGSICNLNEYLGVKPDQPLQHKERKGKVVIYTVARPSPQDRQLEFRRLLTARGFDVIVPNDESELVLLFEVERIFPEYLVVRNIENDLLRSYAGLLQGEQRSRWQAFIKYYQVIASEHNIKRVDVGTPDPIHLPVRILNVPSASLESNEDDQAGEAPEPKEDKKQKPASFVPGLPPNIANLYDQTMIINAGNPTMKQLLEYMENSGFEEIDAVLDLCLHECYHMAVVEALDSLPGDALRHHVEITCGVIQAFVKSQTERLNVERADKGVHDRLAVVREELNAAKRQHIELENAIEAYRRQFGECGEGDLAIPAQPEERMGVVVFCDMVGSTGSFVGMDFDQRGFVLNEFVELAKEVVNRHNGFFDKFTGDGLIALFGIQHKRASNGDFDANHWLKACEQSWAFSKEIEAAMAIFNNKPEIRRVIQQNPQKVKTIELRIAISAGPVVLGRFGARGTAVGTPVIVAARLCSEKEAFKKAGCSILVDEYFRIRSGLQDLKEVDYNFSPRGIDERVSIYQARRRDD